MDAKAGDDLIALDDPPISEDAYPYLLGTILGGEGDDTISVSGGTDGAFVDGGPGHDEIDLPDALSSTIQGGDGNDTISAYSGAGNSGDTTIEGGNGDDLIFAGSGTHALGEAGNDTIHASTYVGWDGSFSSASGGIGDDTFVVDAYTRTEFITNSGSAGTGGGGNDTWDVTINEGDAASVATEGFLDANIDASGIINLSAGFIPDFVVGEDVLIIDATSTSANYSLSSARIEYSPAASGGEDSLLTFRYEGEDGTTRDVTIGIHNAILTWDDITFRGDEFPVLIS